MPRLVWRPVESWEWSGWRSQNTAGGLGTNICMLDHPKFITLSRPHRCAPLTRHCASQTSAASHIILTHPHIRYESPHSTHSCACSLSPHTFSSASTRVNAYTARLNVAPVAAPSLHTAASRPVTPRDILSSVSEAPPYPVRSLGYRENRQIYVRRPVRPEIHMGGK